MISPEERAMLLAKMKTHRKVPINHPFTDSALATMAKVTYEMLGRPGTGPTVVARLAMEVLAARGRIWELRAIGLGAK